MNNFEAIEAYLKEYSLKFAENTKDSYKTALVQLFTFCPKHFSAVTNEDIEKFVTYMFSTGQWKKGNCVALKISAFRMFFDFCRDEEWITENPVNKLEKVKINEQETRYLSKIDLFLLREAANDNERDRTIIETLITTGLRTTELIYAQKAKFNYEDGTIEVLGKGNRERVVIMTIECAERIHQYLDKRTDNSEYLFINRFGNHFSRQGLWKLINKYIIAAGIDDKYSTHSLRHSFATYFNDAGGSDQQLSDLLGNKVLKNVNRYTHILPDSRKKEFDKFSK